MKKKSFTLLEILFSLVVFGIIFGVLFSIFIRIINTKASIETRQLLVQSTYDTIEQINTQIQNYSIDYEEYFNRTMVGCSTAAQWNNFVWDSWAQLWHCLKWTQYGNGTPLINWGLYVWSESQHKLYYCSSNVWAVTQQAWFLLWAWWWNCRPSVFSTYTWSTNYASNSGRFMQPYWQYKNMFIDIKADADWQWGRAWDDDDTDVWNWSIAVGDNMNVKEIYMISKDKKIRLFFRRKLLATWDFNANGAIDIDNEKLYAIQMLRLKAFDAWQNHDFDATTYSWVFDGNIDTWACDYDAGYKCNWASLGWVYSWYNLPLDNNDWWINITNSNITITDWNIRVFPIKDPEFSWWEPPHQTNPYIKLYLKTAIYWENRIWKVGKDNIEEIMFDVQTTLNMKSNY